MQIANAFAIIKVEWDELSTGKALMILDEAQAWPEVFPRLRGAIDAERSRKGRFVLLGSVAPPLMTQVSESLAGRLALVELEPFLAPELPSSALQDLWLYGGYPEGGILDPPRYPHWQQSYLALLAQRDLPNWGLPAKPQLTDRLLRMLAAVHGQLWNASQIGQSLGLSHSTVNSYLDYLEGAFLIRRLLPLRGNLKKRLTKSPKVFWRDSGLLHALLNARDLQDLLSRPWVGASWEGFVIEQVLGTLQLDGTKAEPCFFRTSDGYEIDLVVEFAGKRWAIETKLTTQPSPQDVQRLRKTAGLVGADQCVLVSQAKTPSWGDRVSVCALPDLLRRLTRARK